MYRKIRSQRTEKNTYLTETRKQIVVWFEEMFLLIKINIYVNQVCIYFWLTRRINYRYCYR